MASLEILKIIVNEFEFIVFVKIIENYIKLLALKMEASILMQFASSQIV